MARLTQTKYVQQQETVNGLTGINLWSMVHPDTIPGCDDQGAQKYAFPFPLLNSFNFPYDYVKRTLQLSAQTGQRPS
eukprot:6481382-Amphidinium_carterae.1